MKKENRRKIKIEKRGEKRSNETHRQPVDAQFDGKLKRESRTTSGRKEREKKREEKRRRPSGDQ